MAFGYNGSAAIDREVRFEDVFAIHEIDALTDEISQAVLSLDTVS